MHLKCLFLLICFLLRPSAAVNDSCIEYQCRLLVNESGVPTHDQFQSKASETNVRIVYLNLKIGNNTYKPLDSEDKFLPMRWVWARSSAEHMLSLSYDYDILSLGLLSYQFSNMDVNLIEEPSGCLANLTSSCRDVVVAKTLLEDVTRESSTKPSLEPEAVCVAVILKAKNFIDWYRDLFEGNVEFQCCETEKLVNKTLVRCGVGVKYSVWLTAVYYVLNTVTYTMLPFWPLLFLVLPDLCFNFRKERRDKSDRSSENRAVLSSENRAVETEEVSTEVTVDKTAVDGGKDMGAGVQLELSSVNPAVEEELSTSRVDHRKESNARDLLKLPTVNPAEDEEFSAEMSVDEIAVDDVSPITWSDFLQSCAKNFPDSSNYFKLYFLWFLLSPMLFYIISVLSITMKGRYLDETSRKHEAYIQGQLFSILFDIRSIKVYIPLSISFLLPGAIMYFAAPLLQEKVNTKCCVCKKALNVRKNMIEHLKMLCNDIYTMKHLRKLCIMLKMYKLSPIFEVFKEYGPYSVIKKCLDCIRPREFTKKRILLYGLCGFFWGIGAILVAFFYSLLLVIYGAMCGIFGAFFLILFIVCSILGLIIYCPFTCFLILIIRIVGKAMPFCVENKFFLGCNIALSSLWLAYGSCIAALCCRFVVRMFGFVIMGFIFNMKLTAPLLSFAFVLVNNIYMCYSNVQERYKEVKEMISEQCKEEGNSLPNADVNSDTIPSGLFFYVCNDTNHGVLPIAGEVCYMLLTIAVISTSLFLALAAIIFSDQTFESSPLISVIAVFVSGKIPELFFKGLMKETKLTGKDKINRKRAIKRAVKIWFIEQKKGGGGEGRDRTGKGKKYIKDH